MIGAAAKRLVAVVKHWSEGLLFEPAPPPPPDTRAPPTADEARREGLLDKDWSAEWESLPDAPPLVPKDDRPLADLTDEELDRFVEVIEKDQADPRRTTVYPSEQPRAKESE